MTKDTNGIESSSPETLEQRLNRETARISWGELARLFATGVVIVVADGHDLVSIATCFVEDEDAAIKSLMEAGNVWKATDEDAIKWNQRNTDVWAVVVSPWVLVQENK